VSKPFVPSPQQEAIFADIATGEGHTVVEARAGSSKSTSIELGLAHLPRNTSALVVAFNKPIADAMRDRVKLAQDAGEIPKGVAVSTLHSYGLRQLSYALPKRPTVDKDGEKIRGILIPLLTQAWKEWQPETPEDKKPTLDDVLWGSRGPAKKLLSMAKSTLAMTPEAIDALIDNYELSLSPAISRSALVSVTHKAIDACLENQDVVDYDDMVFFPCALKMAMETYDRVFIDEAQDTSASQVKLALKACERGGRITAVGDNFQAIYQFRGAGSDSIDTIRKKLSAKTLKLTVSYRCARKIVELAQTWVPDFEAAPGAPPGIVREIDFQHANPEAGDFVISRTNAPLVSLFFKFVKEGKRVAIQGRDIGARLRTIVTKADRGTTKGSVPAMLDNVTKWKEKEIARLEKLERDTDNIRDAVGCVFAIADDTSTVDEIYSRIDALFDDDPLKKDASRIVLTTAHRGKGLQRSRVWILRDTFMRNRPRRNKTGGVARDDGGKMIWDPPDQAERNAIYVAVSRAERELIQIRGLPGQEE
jgi:DNA helicase II / ATP-dependent DNA helicase PcrA